MRDESCVRYASKGESERTKERAGRTKTGSRAQKNKKKYDSVILLLSRGSPRQEGRACKQRVRAKTEERERAEQSRKKKENNAIFMMFLRQ